MRNRTNKSEVKSALAKLIRNKATGPEESEIEILEALVDFSIDKTRHNKRDTALRNVYVDSFS